MTTETVQYQYGLIHSIKEGFFFCYCLRSETFLVQSKHNKSIKDLEYNYVRLRDTLLPFLPPLCLNNILRCLNNKKMLRTTCIVCDILIISWRYPQYRLLYSFV